MPRLKTEILVSSAMRLADSKMISAAILHRGDPDAGALFVEIEKSFSEARLLCRTIGFDGGYEWICLSGEGWQHPSDISAMIMRERARDPDCWVVSVQDPDGRNIFEALNGTDDTI